MLNGKRIVFFASKESLFKRLDQEILKISKKTKKNILVAGGNSIKNFYPYLNNYKHNLILSDERVVDERSKNSNYNNLSKFVIDKKKIIWPNKNFYQLNSVQKKIDYSEKFLAKNRLFFSILTIGEDGHIASIFYENLQKSLKDKEISSIKIKSEKFIRISISLKKINNIKKNFILILGKKKCKLLNKKNLPFCKIKNSIILATEK